MKKKEGKTTKKRILEVAEKLFSASGFDATSMDDIAIKARVNKASLYYYFKNKEDIVISLFNNVLSDLSGALRTDPRADEDIEGKIENEIAFLLEKRSIFSIMLMEALKDKAFNDIFFHSAKLLIEDEYSEIAQTQMQIKSAEDQKYNVHEFFTGIIPIMMYAMLEDKWCKYNNYDKISVRKNFIEAIKNTHLRRPDK